MKDQRFVTSFDKVRLPLEREDALLERILRAADAERVETEPVQQQRQAPQHTVYRTRKHQLGNAVKPRHKAVKRRAMIVLIAAILLLLSACATVIYISTVSKLKNDAVSQAGKAEAELAAKARINAEAYADGSIPVVTVDSKAQIDDVTLWVKSMELWPMEANTQEADLTLAFESAVTGAIINFNWIDEDIGAQRTLNEYASFCEIGMDARAFVLTVDGTAYAPYLKPDFEGQLEPAAWQKDGGLLSIGFRGITQAITPDTEMVLSGTLYRYDNAGNRIGAIGSFSIPFSYSYSEADRQARIDALTAEGTGRLQTGAQARLDALERLPETATPINVSAAEITFLDIAATEDGFLLGLRYDLECGSFSVKQQPTYYINGYKVGNRWIDDYWETAGSTLPAVPRVDPDEKPCTLTLLEQLPYHVAREHLPQTVTIACVRDESIGTNANDPSIRYTND